MSEEERYVRVHFWGASKTVTGSKFLIETPELNLLIDCGMFQGLKELRLQNWSDLPYDVSQIDAVLLTHGHLDHCGYLPRLVKQGFSGKIIGTSPSLMVAEIILRDSARIQEEEAERANEEGYSKHHPALPLYDLKDVDKTVRLFESQALHEWIQLSENIRFRFRFNGHIIGATFIELLIYDKTFVFSGDIGRQDDILLEPPERPTKADFLFIESTYGDRLHPTENVEDRLTEIILDRLDAGGDLIIPSFAVERLQMIVYLLWTLFKDRRIPDVPIYMDSPMGERILALFEGFTSWHKLSLPELHQLYDHIHIVESYAETWKVIDNKSSKIVVAGSGMITGGRVLTYLQKGIDSPQNRVLLVGYQAEGTRGRQLLEGAHEIKIKNKYLTVKAKILHIESMSAHADQSGLISWCSEIENRPEKVFIVHGEPTAADCLRVKLHDTFGWDVQVAQPMEMEELISQAVE